MPGARPAFEVADIFRRHGDAFRVAHAGHLSRSQLRAMGAIEACRTAALGGHVERCADCGHQRIAYNSCRNRHCPKCQAAAAREWLEARRADLLPVEYFHVVFTLPAPVAAIAYHNKAVVYAMLFEAAAETLKTIAADKRHLGAEIGATMVLHTWGQTLTHHPHVHCIVPGGGLSPGGDRWIACRQGFFLPVRVLSRLYRRLFLEKLTAAHRADKLQLLRRSEAPRRCARHSTHFLAPLRRRRMGGLRQASVRRTRAGARLPEPLYASRRHLQPAAARDRRGRHLLVEDYRHGGRERSTMTLAADEFIRRFLLHVLPDGFQRIRHYGFLANGQRRAKLDLIRRLLAAAAPPTADKAAEDQPERSAADASELPPCPCCGGRMVIIEVLPGPRRRCRRLDTS